ncbi:MAG: hypothetical protein J6I64_04050 [Lachnospiraceae bacterium]|nr:hypothetical protein [Lachnospiraceae bacterium]
MKKQWLIFLAVLVAVYILIGRGLGIKHRIGEDLQLDLFWGNTTLYFDNHDHVWHNDGATVAVIQFTGQAAEAMHEQLDRSIVWEAFPVPEQIRRIAYEKAYTWATPSTFAEMASLPQIQRGYWFFVDQTKQRNGTLLYGQKALENLEDQERPWMREEPAIYALAFYDSDADILYYFQRNL